jgi:hypothetical protein
MLPQRGLVRTAFQTGLGLSLVQAGVLGIKSCFVVDVEP